MDKKYIAEVFEEIATLLELKNENPFKIRAYRNAARTLLNMDEELDAVIQEDRLTDFPGIGDDLAEKITLLAQKGHLPFFDKLKRSTPKGLLELMQVHGLGGKRIKAIYDKFKIHSLAALKKACLEGQLSKLRGFGQKTEQNILDSIAHLETYHKRRLWWDAMALASPILKKLRQLKGVKKAEIAGSLRRKRETIGDLDFVVGASNPKQVMNWFTSQSFVDKILGKGDTKSSVRLKEGIQADIRIVPENQFAFALCYFTGSKEHNIRMRERALARGWSLSEYDLQSLNPKKSGPLANVKKPVTEDAIYKVLGLAYIPPELREDQGEFEVAEKGKLPKLVEEKDIRGTFHNHTSASDGKNTLKEMVLAAEKMGWEYIGIADHSKSSFQANGLSEQALANQIEEIRKMNASRKFRTHIFAGVECDILPDGSLDMPDRLLKKLDYVVAAVHSSLTQDEKKMTRRIIRAMEHPLTTMLAHPTGRILLKREPYAVNMRKVIDACIANKKIIEINCSPERLDMDWRLWHGASRKGLMCSINTDAHSIQHLEFFRAGVNSARKGWLGKKHILNTKSLKEVRAFFAPKN